MKAFCLVVVSLLVLIPPAAADETADKASAGVTADDLQGDQSRLYRLESLLQQNSDQEASTAWSSGNAQADAEFAGKVRALLALAREEVRLAAASPHPVQLEVNLRCIAERLVVSAQARPSSLVPALEWSAEQTAPAVSTRMVRACAIKLRRRALPESSATMQPYSVDLPVIEQAR